MQRMRLNSLTSLRFFAALAVVAYHLIAVFHPSGPAMILTGWGFTGVTFFFVLSGLVLTWSHSERDTASRFYRKRFARIWPTHALTWGASFLLASTGAAAAGLNLLLLQAWVPRYSVYFSANGVAWTLSCEAFFYACFPLIYRALARVERPERLLVGWTVLYLLAGGVAYAAVGHLARGFWLLYVCPAYRVGEFILGVMLGLALRRGWRLALPLRVPVAVIAAGLVVAEVVSPTKAGMYDSPHVWIYGALVLPGVALLLAAAASRDLAGTSGVLGQPWLLRLGVWSFALYMTHQLLMHAAARLATGWGGALLAVALLIPVAALAYRLWERPWERALRGARPRAEDLDDRELAPA